MSFSKFLFFVTIVTLSSFAKAEDKSRFEKLELFNKVLYMIESQYYRNVDTETLIEGAIKGMMDTLDPHSSFLDKDLYKRMQEDTEGEFGGLGIEVTQKDGVMVIITPIEDSPADKAGLLPGDKIVEINGESIIGLPLDEATTKLKGEIGTSVNMGIVREGIDGIKRFDIKREIVHTKPVKSELLDDNYLWIRLKHFQKKSGELIAEEIIKTEKKIGEKKLKGIILDLRSNPGGLLEEAVNLASIFLKSGVVVSTEGRDQKKRDIRYVKKSGHKELDVPLIVLINGATASASEIVAGALQDSKRAIIMGTQSFGKGTVQTVSKIDEQNGLKMTIAQYMTPSGKKIQAEGIIPDVIVKQVSDKFVEELLKEEQVLREKDLRNHLTAFIESDEESKKGPKKSESNIINLDRKSKLRNDYQIIQAIKYLKGLEVYKNILIKE